jgi:uncharacterized paraquat-inducible protein A
MYDTGARVTAFLVLALLVLAPVLLAVAFVVLVLGATRL